MDLIDPSQPCVKPIATGSTDAEKAAIQAEIQRRIQRHFLDTKMIQVWLAEAKFLSCFENLFDLKFANNLDSNNSAPTNTQT